MNYFFIRIGNRFNEVALSSKLSTPEKLSLNAWICLADMALIFCMLFEEKSLGSALTTIWT